VLDYVFVDPGAFGDRLEHRETALNGMAEIAIRLERYWKIQWDEDSLKGRPVTFAEFWGADDVASKPVLTDDPKWAGRVVLNPNVDGYKTAFFCPPHGLRGSFKENAELFSRINEYVLGEHADQAEIYAWSTDWSDYFESGLEWWGAFYWTIRPVRSSRMVVVAASTTD